jgi:glycosyltransferase involved in cell wall biosynthesis
MILRARPKVLLFLRRLALGQKGLGRLLQGYAAFLAHTGDRQTHLTLAGPDFRNGRQGLEKLAADLRIVDRVSFKGPVNGEAKWTLLRSSYALVHPSRWEGMPFSVLEALAVGCPALITAETNLAEMVQAHATGIVVSGLPQDIAQGLQELISMPPERYDAMRHQARKVIEDHCTWDQVTASMAQLYQDVVGGARHT